MAMIPRKCTERPAIRSATHGDQTFVLYATMSLVNFYRASDRFLPPMYRHLRPYHGDAAPNIDGISSLLNSSAPLIEGAQTGICSPPSLSLWFPEHLDVTIRKLAIGKQRRRLVNNRRRNVCITAGEATIKRLTCCKLRFPPFRETSD